MQWQDMIQVGGVGAMMGQDCGRSVQDNEFKQEWPGQGSTNYETARDVT